MCHAVCEVRGRVTRMKGLGVLARSKLMRLDVGDTDVTATTTRRQQVEIARVKTIGKRRRHDRRELSGRDATVARLVVMHEAT